MRDTFLRLIADDERNMLYDMIRDEEESSYRAKIILLKDEGYILPEIRMATNHHDITTSESGFTASMRKVLRELYPENTETNQSKYRSI
jgi:hypothetical protein